MRYGMPWRGDLFARVYDRMQSIPRDENRTTFSPDIPYASI